MLNDISSCNTHFGINLFFFIFQHGVFSLFFSLFFFWSPGTTPDAKIGLWTLSPRFSAVLPHPEPTIPFLDWSAVSHPKPRDPVSVTSGFGHVISGHFQFRWRHFRSLPVPVMWLEPANPPLATPWSAVAFPVSNSENQSEARKVPHLSAPYYFEAESELSDRKKVVNFNIRDPSFTEKNA